MATMLQSPENNGYHKSWACDQSIKIMPKYKESLGHILAIRRNLAIYQKSCAGGLPMPF